MSRPDPKPRRTEAGCWVDRPQEARARRAHRLTCLMHCPWGGGDRRHFTIELSLYLSAFDQSIDWGLDRKSVV